MALALEAAGPAIYFACTSGGAAQIGQIWRYVPSLHEGLPGEADVPGGLELFVESTGERDFEKCDNIVASLRGELIVVRRWRWGQFPARCRPRRPNLHARPQRGSWPIRSSPALLLA